MLKSLFSIVLLSCMLTACSLFGAKPEPKRTSVPVSSSEASVARSQAGLYLPFSPEILGNGQRSVLYFHADWDPLCQIYDKKLDKWYRELGFPISTYKVDYDHADQLRDRYSVASQHVFVLIDAKGNSVRTLQYPSDDLLQVFLNS